MATGMRLGLRDKWQPILLGLLVVALTQLLQLTDHPATRQLTQRLEFIGYDLRLNLLPIAPQRERAKIVIIDVDERSLQAEGRWPWPRTRLAELVRRLANQGVAVVAFDMVFSEPDRNPVDEVLAELPAAEPGSAAASVLRRIRGRLDRDAVFAAALGEVDSVLGFVLHNGPAGSVGRLPNNSVAPDTDQPDRLTLLSMEFHTGNLARLQQATPAAGFLVTLPDLDGTLRRSPLVLNHQGAVYPSLALETARVYQLFDDFAIDSTTVGQQSVLQAVRLGNDRFVTDPQGNILIPYRGRSGSFTTLSAADVLQGKVPEGRLENAIVIVGTSAIGLADLKATPVQSVFPGVEIQATLLDGLLNGGFPSQPDWAKGADFASQVLIGGLLAFVLPLLGPAMLALMVLAVGGLWLGSNLWLWASHGYMLVIVLPLLMLLGLLVVNMAWGFLFESRRRDQLKGLFGQYVPPQLVEEMSRNPESYAAEGESREMSVLFADIRSFTTISESLSASDLKALLNRFFTPMTQVIFDNRGTIDKYVGDMIMAFWGAPIRDSRHAGQAIDAAMEMLRQVERMRPELSALGYPEINIGIGINTGMMNVGDMGSSFRRAYTVLGDSVNLASRLEGLTKYYGVSLVVGENTREQVPHYAYRQLDRVKVKGKQQAVAVFEPIAPADQLNEEQRDELRRYHEALQAFWAQQWQQADSILRQLHSQQARPIYQLYLERIEALRKRELADDWDGVFERREK